MKTQEFLDELEALYTEEHRSFEKGWNACLDEVIARVESQ
jgi:hypothetical protein